MARFNRRVTNRVTGPFARRLPSAPLAGTLTAVVAVPVAGALGGLVLAVAR